MFFATVKQKEVLVKQFNPVYEIIPSPLYGWNFKCAESRHIIKFSKEQDELIEYATAYCRTHSSELIIYNYYKEIDKILRFESEALSELKDT